MKGSRNAAFFALGEKICFIGCVFGGTVLWKIINRRKSSKNKKLESIGFKDSSFFAFYKVVLNGL